MVFCKIEWSKEDLREVFEKYQISFTAKNIDSFLSEGVARTLESVSIECGWDVLDDLAYSFANKMNISEI